MSLNDIIAAKAKQNREEALSFEQSLQLEFDSLREKTEENLERINEQIDLRNEAVELENQIANKVGVIAAMFSKTSLLENLFYAKVEEKLSKFPKKTPEELIPPPPQSSPSPPPTKMASGGVVPGKTKQERKEKQLQPYADTLSLPLQASGIAALSVLGDFIKSSGALGGFFKPYLNSVVKPFSVALGITDNVVNSLVGGPVQAATLDLNQQQKDFGKTWGQFLGDEDFIKKFIDRTLDGRSGEDIDPGDFTGNASEKAAKIAKMLMKDLGYADYQAAAIVGNLTQENTNLVPDLLEGSKKGLLRTAMDKGIGYGWAQWTDPGRQQELYNLAKSMGVNPDTEPLTDAVNYAMLKQEFPTYDSGGRFKASKTIEEASNWVLTQYERPADQGPREQAERIADSKAVLAKISAARGASIGNTKNLLTTYLVSGSESGFDTMIQGIPATLHGMEIVDEYEGGFSVYPIKNKQFDFKKDPVSVAKRWRQIAMGAKTQQIDQFSSGGVSEGVKAIQHDEALSSLTRGVNDFITKGGLSVHSSTPWGKIKPITPLHAYETGVSGDRTTIGWGMTYYDSITSGKKAVKSGDVITKSKADSLLTGLVNNYSNTLSGEKWYQKYWNRMSSQQQAGLLAYGYNQPAHLLGAGAPKMYAALNRGDMNAVAANIDRGLPEREKNEKRLVLSGPRNLNTATASTKPKVIVNRIDADAAQPNIIQQVQSAITFIPNLIFNSHKLKRELGMRRAR